MEQQLGLLEAPREHRSGPAAILRSPQHQDGIGVLDTPGVVRVGRAPHGKRGKGQQADSADREQRE